MPQREKQACEFPFCGRLSDGKRWCPVHMKGRRKLRGQAAHDKKLYSSRSWQKMRAVILMRHPLCEMCERKHRVTPSTDVDHIIPRSQGGTEIESNSASHM